MRHAVRSLFETVSSDRLVNANGIEGLAAR
jgi:hypothetical protein